MSSVPGTKDEPVVERLASAVFSGGRKGVVAGRVAIAPTAAGAGSTVPEGVITPASGQARAVQAASDQAHEAEKRAPNRRGTTGTPAQSPIPGSAAAAGSSQWAQQREIAERSLERRIRAHLIRGELSVTLTDNRYTMISVRRDGKSKKCFKVRLHHMFADASPVITRALARYVAHNDRDASRLLGDYIDAHQHRVRAPSRQRAAQRLTTRGRIHDLAAIFDDLNRRYFGGRIEARITWGQRVGKPKRRNSIKMGSYSVEEKLIRIHRSLDRPFVPRFFVEWVVFHEMLHQVHDIVVINGRRRFHSKEFLRDEAKFEHYVSARAWERANLDALLTC
ncbi:MAG: hypothetical protein MJE77_31995 [Proteobacteria bacterium]|nr:hypothetical protein [Pseudomonadota bacterium]